MNNNQSRINLLKEVKSAVNTASFAPTADRIEDARKAVLSLMSYVESLEAPKRKASKKQKSSKATPSTKVADRQEKAFHGKPDTPVTPCHAKRTASVEEARKSAQEVSDKSGATARAKRKADAIAKASAKEAAASPDVMSPDAKRLADLEAKIEALLALQAMGHDLMSRNENEVLFSDLPFDPSTNF
jgi:hypothetical protein